MDQLEQLTKPPVEPIYWQAAPSETIDFGSVRVSVPNHTGEEMSPVDAHARLRFTPNESLEFFIPETNDGSPLARFHGCLTNFETRNIKIRLPEHGTSFDAFCKSSSDGNIYRPVLSQVQIRPQSTSISNAVFHLINWPEFLGQQDYILLADTTQMPEVARCGRFSLTVGDWLITVAATESTSSAVKRLRENGGHIITHVGDVRRMDGEDFSTKDFDELLTLLSYFFSFSFARWSCPSLAVGYDTSGDRVYEQLGLARCASGAWQRSLSWFNEQRTDFFLELMPGFNRLWSNEVWRRPITEVIYWYVSANRTGSDSGVGVDSALLFTQAALELLSWTHCVLDKGMVSENAFKPRGLSAADRLRLLASSLDLPLEIPRCLTSLHARRGKKWKDSMDAITDLRNGLVHPGTERSIPDGAYVDAWRLSQWYIELALLRLCSYSGSYSNRLRRKGAWEIEPVPWSVYYE